MAGSGGRVDVAAAQAQLAASMVALALAAIAECGLVVLHPRSDEVIDLISDQVEGARADGLSGAETALLVLDALAEQAEGVAA